MISLGNYRRSSLLPVAVVSLILCSCAVDFPATHTAQDTPISIERLEKLQAPDGGSELVQELIAANNSAVDVANTNASAAEKFSEEARLRGNEAEKLKITVKKQAEAQTWNDVMHWVLEGGLVTAVVMLAAIL